MRTIFIIMFFYNIISTSLELDSSLSDYHCSNSYCVSPNEEFSEKLTNFYLNLYRQILANGQNSNIFFSPTSIILAMAMVYEGADGETKNQINKVLFSEMKDELLDKNLAQLSKFLSAKPENQEECSNTKELECESEYDYVLNMANRLYSEKSFQILNTFSEKLRKNYETDIISTDFFQNPKKAESEINQWIFEKTNGKISNLVEGIDDEVKLILVNAIYFKGQWQKQFDQSKTAQKQFHVAENQVKNVDMMVFGKLEKFQYGEHENSQVLKMKYGHSDLSMIFVLPKETYGLEKLEQQLNGQIFLKLLKETHNSLVKVEIPKFKLEGTIDLMAQLKSMGVVELFTEKANLSKITDKPDLFVGAAVHKAFIEVNEKGSEAEAATPCTGRTKRSAPITHEFIADHPFLLAVVHEKINAVLFLGRFCG